MIFCVVVVCFNIKVLKSFVVFVDLESFTQPNVLYESELQPPEPVPQHRPSLPDEITYEEIESSTSRVLSVVERRGTPALLSATVSDNFGNSPQVAAPRRPREIDQSTQRCS